MMRFLSLCCFPLLLAAQTAVPEAPKLRLPDSVRPTHYALELALEPGKDSFTGTVDIDVEVRSPQQTIWLNAAALEIREATIGGQPAKIVKGNDQVTGLAAGRPVPAGRTRLHLAYSGGISRNSSAGIFQLEDEKRWYIFTQFEPTDARRAFPCFDEPSFKTPFDVSLRVRKELVAVANAPQTGESEVEGGLKLVRFATTRPMPTYLVAFGVGPFEIVELGKAGRSNTPMRIVLPYGRKNEAQFAAETMPQLFRRLEDYFGIPYPYTKLDSLVMPIANFAMENVGLITYGQSLLLSKPETDSVQRRRTCAIVAAHEMAHQWFGNLVTTAWWDDIWLNEAFASWMESKIVAEWKPEWRIETSDVNDRLGAMGTDGLMNARKIRQPIGSHDDIANAFDGITYRKGASVIHMFESWLGAVAFRKGVQLYLKENSDRSATARQFLAAVGKATGKEVAPAFSTFLEQAGVPVVSMQLDCNNAQPRLSLTQKRYLPIGSAGSPPQTWQIPFCVKFEAEGQVRSRCELVADPRTTMPLAGAGSCPAWVMGNAGAGGYYRVAYQPDTLARLLTSGLAHLSLPEKISLLGDVNALVDGGDMQAASALALVPKLAGAPEREIVRTVRQIAARAVGRVVPDALLPEGRRFIRDVFGEQATRLGWKTAASDSDDTRLLRQTVLWFVAGDGQDQKLIGEAASLARAWLADRTAVDAGMAEPIVTIAARYGDRAFFDALVAALANEKDRRAREVLFRGLSSFEDPVLARASMQLFLKGNYDIRESFQLLFGPLDFRGTRTLPFEFVKQNLDVILAKLPREVGSDYAAWLSATGEGFCDADGRAQVQSFFEERVKQFTGGPRNLAQVLEKIDICAARAVATGPSIVGFLEQYKQSSPLSRQF